MPQPLKFNTSLNSLQEMSSTEIEDYISVIIGTDFANTVGVIIGMFLIPIAIKVINKISVRYSIIRDEFKIYVWVLKSIPKVFRKWELIFPSLNNLKEFFVLKEKIPVKILLIA